MLHQEKPLEIIPWNRVQERHGSSFEIVEHALRTNARLHPTFRSQELVASQQVTTRAQVGHGVAQDGGHEAVGCFRMPSHPERLILARSNRLHGLNIVRN